LPLASNSNMISIKTTRKTNTVRARVLTL